ncbi:MAG TPA: hypothetical protein VLM76_09765 [Patescibacteria group bacterium]|nr:hypothetical protein [Patescibacteria group bacterium]
MATRAISTPDPGFTGTRAGVVFRDGRGEVEADNASALAYFARHGYVLGEPAAPVKRGRAPARPAEADLDGSTAVDEPEG